LYSVCAWVVALAASSANKAPVVHAQRGGKQYKKCI
jgi:hypothetical protein